MRLGSHLLTFAPREEGVFLYFLLETISGEASDGLVWVGCPLLWPGRWELCDGKFLSELHGWSWGRNGSQKLGGGPY